MSTQTVAVDRVLVQQGAARPRLPYLDNLRTWMITLIVLGHVAFPFMGEGDWYYTESGELSTPAFVIALLFTAIGTAFFLGLFFMIAGYLTPGAYDRKGTGRFVLDRLQRLGLPLLFYEVVLNPLINHAVAVHQGDHRGSLWLYLPGYFGGLDSIGDGPVWFLEALLILSVLYALWRLAARPEAGPLRDKTDDIRVPGNGTIALFALVVGVVTFVVRIWAPVNRYYEPWHLEPAHFTQYIALFLAGMAAYRRNWLVCFSDRQARPWRWVALLAVLLLPVLAVAAGALSGRLDDRGAGGPNWLSLAYSVWEGFTCVAMVITALTWFRSRWNQQGRLARAMSEASFAVYVLHPAIVVPFGLALSGLRLNLDLKFLLEIPVALTLCYLVAHILRRIPLLRSVLG